MFSSGNNALEKERFKISSHISSMFKLIQSFTCLQTLPTRLSEQSAGTDPSTHPTNQPACTCLLWLPPPHSLRYLLWLCTLKTVLVFRLKDNLLLPRCVVLLTRQTSQSEIFILLIMQTRHASDSLFQTITNHPGSLPRLSHIPILKMEPHVGRFFSRFREGKAADKKPEGCSTLHQLAMLPEGKYTSWGEADVLQWRASAFPPPGAKGRDGAGHGDGNAVTAETGHPQGELPPCQSHGLL